MATRAKITRRKLLAERHARVLCRMDGKDPDGECLAATPPGRAPVYRPRWERYRREARRQLEAQGWPE